MSVLRLPSAGSLGKLASPAVNWRDPINKRLIVANHVDNIEGRDLVSGTPFKWYQNSVGAPPVYTPAKVGRAVACLHDYGFWGGGNTFNPIAATDDVTVLLWAREDAVMNRGFFRRGKDGQGSGWSIQFGTANSVCNPTFSVVWTSPGLVGRGVTNAAAAINSGAGLPGMWMLGRFVQGKSLSLFCENGTVVHDTSSIGSSLRSSTYGIAMTGGTSSTGDGGSYIHHYGLVGNDVFIWARGLSDRECWDILADPLRVYRRPPSLVFFDAAVAGGGGGVTGDSSAVIEGTNGSAAGTVAVAGSSAATVGTATGTAAATAAIASSSAQTLANVAGIGTGTVQIYGTSSGALGSVTGVAAGVAGVAGSSIQALDPVAGTATGVVGSTPITGVSNVTVGAVTGVAAGTGAISGASVAGVGAVAGAAAGAVEAIGGSSRALDSVAGAATGVIGSAPIAGASAVILVGVFGSAAGECQIRGASGGIVGAVTAPGDGAPTLTSDPRYTVRASRGRFVVTSPSRQFKVAA